MLKTKVMKQVVTLANILTALRLFIAFLVIGSILREEHGWALYWFIFGALTDYLDGIAARWLDQVTKLGKLFDPAVDKIFLVGVLLALLGFPENGFVGLGFAALLVAEAVLFSFGIVGVFMFTDKEMPGANKWGKRKAISEIFLIFFLIVFRIADWTMPISALVAMLMISIALALLSIKGHWQQVRSM